MRPAEALKPKTNEDTAQGLAFAVSAYVIWGFLPLYMKLLAHIPPPEVVPCPPGCCTEWVASKTTG